MTSLFEPFTLRGVTLRNRIGISPMCQYSSEDGHATDWHLIHMGARAIGGAGLVIAEATAITPEGRISPQDAGLWQDSHIEPLARITRFVRGQGSIPGIQLAHAGRKASTVRPWEAAGRPAGLSDAEGGWEPVAPGSTAFASDYRTPRELSVAEIHDLQRCFVDATHRALAAGYEWLELHAAHGYLAHSFLSPLSNQRQDEYGGSFENRIRFVLETARAMRAAWPEDLPCTVRLSCTDWAEGGWTLDESVELSRQLKESGIDLIDCSSGGGVAGAKIPVGPGYQVPFAERIRREAGIPTAAVGMITAPAQANDIVQSDQADLVLLARESLRDPQWPLHAARELGVKIQWPPQYERAALS